MRKAHVQPQKPPALSPSRISCPSVAEEEATAESAFHLRQSLQIAVHPARLVGVSFRLPLVGLRWASLLAVPFPGFGPRTQLLPLCTTASSRIRLAAVSAPSGSFPPRPSSRPPVRRWQQTG